MFSDYNVTDFQLLENNMLDINIWHIEFISELRNTEPVLFWVGNKNSIVLFDIKIMKTFFRNLVQ